MEPTSMSDSYEKRRKEMLSALKGVSKRAGTDVAKKLVKEEERSNDKDCEIARMVFHESLDEYESGEMEWSEMVDELAKTLKAIKE